MSLTWYKIKNRAQREKINAFLNGIKRNFLLIISMYIHVHLGDSQVDSNDCMFIGLFPFKLTPQQFSSIK